MKTHMKKTILFSMACYLLAMLFGCSEMNDVHDMYIKDGEIIYVGRVDSTRFFAGDERFKLSYWVTDPKAKILKIYWSQKMDSVVLDIPTHNPKDSIDLVIGDVSHPIPEGSHTFQLYTYDGDGLRSILYEEIGNVYGDKFVQTLSSRLTQDVNYTSSDSTLTIEWGGLSSSKEIGVTINYTDLDEGEKVLSLATEEIGSQTLIKGLDPTKPVTYQTAFLPEEEAIDTFNTDVLQLQVKQTINVALNKPVSVSDTYNATYVGPNAVDGVISAASRWLSTASGDHWIEVDLGQEYTINGFAMYVGSYGNLSNPVLNFNFQVDNNGTWEDVVTITGNNDPGFSTNFPEVTTGKVRLFIPDYADNLTRLYELEVYSTITY